MADEKRPGYRDAERDAFLRAILGPVERAPYGDTTSPDPRSYDVPFRPVVGANGLGHEDFYGQTKFGVPPADNLLDELIRSWMFVAHAARLAAGGDYAEQGRADELGKAIDSAKRGSERDQKNYDSNMRYFKK